MWRPSRRTSLEAHVGERYGSMTYRGSFCLRAELAQQLQRRRSMTASTGFGGMMVNQLASCRAEFERSATRSPGEIGGCVADRSQRRAATCLASALGSIRSAVFRSRGVAASSYSPTSAAPSSASAAATTAASSSAPRAPVLDSGDGVVDENDLARRPCSDRGSTTPSSTLQRQSRQLVRERIRPLATRSTTAQRRSLLPRLHPRPQRHRRGRARRHHAATTCPTSAYRLGAARPALLVLRPRRRRCSTISTA